jgi:Tfp pilus assembly protein PilF
MRNRLPGFLAIFTLGLPTFLAVNASAAEVKITRISDPAAFEVSGGSGAQAWHIRYNLYGIGTPFPNGPGPTVLSAEGPESIAFFTHQNWLRRVDVEKGIVTGRWHFPEERIRHLAWKNDHLEVQVEGRLVGTFLKTIDFYPDKPQIPYWPSSFILSNSTPQLETYCCQTAVNTSQANQWRAEAENAVQRDPLTPWFRIQLAHIYKALGRPEAADLFRQAIRLDSEDYSELLRISATLDDDDLPELAREAFERGYAEYWKRGMDPRLNSALLNALILYTGPRRISETLRPELIDRRYRIAPWVEYAGYAWESYASFLESTGKSQEATLWRGRAMEARQNSLFIFSRTLMREYETIYALVPAAYLAAVLFIVALYLRYRPERRLHARAQQAGFIRRFSFFNVEYWSRSDRIAFFLIGVAGWLTLGAAGAITQIRVRVYSMPLSVGAGSLAGPVTTSYIEKNLPPSPERDLLLATGYQQEGQTDKAEQLYNGPVLGFAEGWNNRGALFQESGRTSEARAAFGQALSLDPNMPEARWNSEHKSVNFWTEMHQKYVPDRPMIAPPSREHFLRAVGLGSPYQLALQALGGPFTGYGIGERGDFGESRMLRFVIPRPFSVAFVLTLAQVIAAVLILLIVPYRDVTQPAFESQTLVEYVLPGTASQWRQFGGIVLLVWAALLLQWLTSRANIATFAFGGFPNIQRAFSVPVTSQPSDVFQSNAPYMLAGLVLLYVLNTVLILRSRRQP